LLNLLDSIITETFMCVSRAKVSSSKAKVKNMK